MLVAGGTLSLALFPFYASGQVVRSNIPCKEDHNCSALITTLVTGESLNPCDVTATFAAKCQNQTQSTLPTLPPGYVYYGPTSEGTDNHICQCNMFFYSLLSACAYCQGNDWIPWSLFTMNCTVPLAHYIPTDRQPNVTIDSSMPWTAVEYGPGTDTFSVPGGC